MKTYQANLLNVIALIGMSLWAYFTYVPTVEKPNAYTALIPLAFGVILFLCNKGVKKENKIIAHIAVLATLLALIGLTVPLNKAIAEDRSLGVFRISVMILTGIVAMITFIKSFIAARKKA